MFSVYAGLITGVLGIFRDERKWLAILTTLVSAPLGVLGFRQLLMMLSFLFQRLWQLL